MGIIGTDEQYTTVLPEPAPDGDSLQKLAETVSRLCGMELSVWDAECRSRGYGGGVRGQFCTLLHNCGKGLDLCVQSDNEAFRRARESGKTICYRCPFGLVEAVAPILRGGKVLGYAMLGKAVEDLPGRDAEIARALCERYPGIEKLFPVEERIAEMPHLCREALDDSLRLLGMFAATVAERELSVPVGVTFAETVRRYLDRNLEKRLTLPELGVRFHCSTVTLNAHFRRAYGVTVLHYLNEKRMALAGKLLRQTDMTVTEISERCGFSDADYFSRAFRRRNGRSPQAWRQDPDPLYHT